MTDLRRALHTAADAIADFRQGLTDARVDPAATRADVVASLETHLQDAPIPLSSVIQELVSTAAPGLVATAGPRFFGFVIGGSLDAALVADVVASGWDQVGFNEATSPAAMAFEDVAGRWLKDLLGIPATASVGFVTGAQAANTVGLAAGRWKVLHDRGWDVGRDGLFGARSIRVIAGVERHATIDRTLRLLGIGERSIVAVPALASGAMDPAAVMAALEADRSAPTIVCAQSGNVNTGACDDLRTICTAARSTGAWVHVDGAFGLWAGASPRLRHLVDGIELADSWGCDGHKWLNVPYDAGYAFCAHPAVHATSMAYTATYLTGQVEGRTFVGGDLVPESSRRARGFATWAALRSLGRDGVTELVDRCCGLGRRFASGLMAADIEVVNDVILNQVLVRVGDEPVTDEIERRLRADGTCWIGATTWRGERLLRISVSNWSTTESDVDRSVAAILSVRSQVMGEAATG